MKSSAKSLFTLEIPSNCEYSGLQLVIYDLSNILEILFSVMISKNSFVTTFSAFFTPNIFTLLLDQCKGYI